MPSHTLTIAGCSLAYDLRGEGVPVLFIQGVGVHGDGWLPQVNGLQTRAACLTFDNRGMGRSQPVVGAGKDQPPLGADLTVERMSLDALAIMDAVGWKSAHVVGHSLGGLIAQDVALRARERVRSLSLLCTFARGKTVGMSGRMIWLGIRTRVGTRPMRRRAFLEMVLPPAALASQDSEKLAAELAPLFGHDLADQPPVVMKQLKAMQGCDTTPRLGELAGIPTLVVSAVHDPVAPPAMGRVLAGGIPGSRYVELQNASHGVPIEQPELVNRMLLERFADSDPSRVVRAAT